MSSNQFPSSEGVGIVSTINNPSEPISVPVVVECSATTPNNDVITTTLKNGSANCVAGTADENRYFYEDVVFRYDANGRVRFGLVLETFDANNSDSETTQSDMEDQLKKGEVRVVWHPRGHEVVMPESMVRIL